MNSKSDRRELAHTLQYICTMTHQTDKMVLEDLSREAENRGITLKKYLKTLLDQGTKRRTTPIGEGLPVPPGIRRFAPASFQSYKHGVYTTYKEGVYRHSLTGGHIIYEVRSRWDQPDIIAKRGCKNYVSTFYDKFGKKICSIQSGHTIDRTHSGYLNITTNT